MKQFLYLLVIALFFTACGSTEQTEDEPKDDELTEVSKSDGSENSNEADDADDADKNEPSNEKLTITEATLTEFVPDGYKIHLWKAADLTKDGLEDVLMVVAKNNPQSTDDDGFGDDENRPLFILQQKNGKLVNRGRNDKAILCSGCGGMMGDPFSEYSGDFAVKNGYFSIEQMGGSNWRWRAITTFKYDADKDNWFLHRDGSENWHTGDPDKVDESVSTKKDFGTVKFKDYGGPSI